MGIIPKLTSTIMRKRKLFTRISSYIELQNEVMRLRKEVKLLSRVADSEHERANINEQFIPHNI